MNASETENSAEPANDVLPICTNCKIVAILLYNLLSIIAFIGNGLIISVIFYYRQLRTPTNMLIANLAIGDLMISIFCIPLSYWHVIIFEDQQWIFGAFLCKIFNFLQATAVFISSWTLVAISIDRFIAIMFLMSPWLWLNRKKALYVILFTWLFSSLMALPLFVVNQLEISENGSSVCMEKWSSVSDKFVHTYLFLLFLLQYCLPLAVLLITYTAIGFKMWNSKVPGDAPNTGASLRIDTKNHCSSSSPGQDRRESVKKLIPMVLLVSAIYAICWFPQNLLMNIWVTFDKSVLSHPLILYIWWGAHTLAMFHSIINPFIYYCQNKRIQTGVNNLMRCCLPCTRKTKEIESESTLWDLKRGISTRTYSYHKSRLTC